MDVQYEINMSDIMLLLGDSKRPLIEGEAIFKSKNLFFCGIRQRTINCLLINSSCLQTSNINGQPHEIEIEVFSENNNKKIECKCTCKADAGSKCKHIFATLIYINR